MDAFHGGIKRPFSRLSDRIGGGLLGQVLVDDPGSVSVVVPAGAPFVYAEALGIGQASSSDTGGGGGSGSDAILPVTPGETLTVMSGRVSGNAAPTTVSRGGTVLVTAPAGTSTVGTAKYPGQAPSGSTQGFGGGRLAAKAASSGGESLGPGMGAPASAIGVSRASSGRGRACLTFFASYDDALAFAKSLYGGTWTP